MLKTLFSFIIFLTIGSYCYADNNDVKLLLDSLQRQNELTIIHDRILKEYEDSLQNLKVTIIEQGTKIQTNKELIDAWTNYCAIISGILLAVLAGIGYLSNRSAKEVAFKEMREVKEELEKELANVKDLSIEANQEYIKFSTMLSTLEKEAKKNNGNNQPR
tara:strand:+ start:484 stop:966 length:483 start_codon:yes stop_codon:yes gene_type:complete